MMDLAMNFDTDECLVTAMFDKGNRTKGISVPSKLALFMQLNPVVLAVVYSGVGICIWFISFALSKRIFNKKDLI